MKHALAAVVACLASALVGAPAQAAAPQGSYQQSCRDVSIQGGVLTGTCRTTGGRWERAALGDVNQCAGDIGNLNGALTCGRRTGEVQFYGSSQPPLHPGSSEVRQRRLRCAGIVDPQARARCFNR